MMRWRLLTAMVLLLCETAYSSEALPQRNAAEFRGIYDASTRPAAPNASPRWKQHREGSYGEKAQVRPDGLLLYSPSKRADGTETKTRFWFSLSDLSVRADEGFTLEVELTMPKFGSEFHLQLSFEGTASGAGVAFLRVLNSHTEWGVGDPEQGIGEMQILSSESNAAELHVFRITKQPGGGKWAVYRDGVLLAENLMGETPSGNPVDRIAFGKLREGLMQTTLRSIRWEPSGAYAP